MAPTRTATPWLGASTRCAVVLRFGRLCTAAGSLAIAACAGTAPGEPQPPRGVPAPRVESADPASAPATDPERERLEEVCLATPWEAADVKHGPQPIPPEHGERLAGLIEDCRDVHPELPPARFASTTGIPTSECHYGIARIYFELGHHPEAARWFHRVIALGEDIELGAFAAQMYLESLEALSRQSAPPRTECRRLARGDAARFVRLYCSRSETSDPCPIFRRAAEEPAPGR